MNLHRKFLRLLLLLGSIRRKNVLLKIDKEEFEKRFSQNVEFFDVWTENDMTYRLTSSKKYKGQFFPHEFLFYKNSYFFSSRDNVKNSINGYYWYFENNTKLRITVKHDNLIIALDFIFIPIYLLVFIEFITGNFSPFPILLPFLGYKTIQFFNIRKIFNDIIKDIYSVNFN